MRVRATTSRRHTNRDSAAQSYVHHLIASHSHSHTVRKAARLSWIPQAADVHSQHTYLHTYKSHRTRTTYSGSQSKRSQLQRIHQPSQCHSASSSAHSPSQATRDKRYASITPFTSCSMRDDRDARISDLFALQAAWLTVASSSHRTTTPPFLVTSPLSPRSSYTLISPRAHSPLPRRLASNLLTYY